MSRIRIQAVGVVLTENAILAGLDSSQSEIVATFGQSILRDGLARSSFEAILRGNEFIAHLSHQGNMGYAKIVHEYRVNDKRLPVRDIPEGMVQ